MDDLKVRSNSQGLSVGFYGSLQVPLILEDDSLVTVSLSMCELDANRFVIVLEGFIKLQAR